MIAYSICRTGAQFQQALPYGRPARPRCCNHIVLRGPAKIAEDPEPHGSETVLLVDDDRVIRSAAVRVLERHGYTVVAVDNALDAIAILRGRTQRVDVVMTDLRMPGMTGGDLISAIRQDAPEVPIVVASGADHRDEREKQGVPATIPYLKKPWTIDELLAIVRSAIDKGPG